LSSRVRYLAEDGFWLLEHQVTNVSPNVKVAWDFYDACKMHKYVEVQSIASRCFKGAMAKDYISFNMVLSTLVGG
jgi:hypothetical protein